MIAQPCKNTSSESCLAFFKSIIEPPFDEDTNANVGHVWIALIYPDIEIYDGQTTHVVDCMKKGFAVSEHAYPLLRFLEQFPEVCEKIISSHPHLMSAYREFVQ